ncbi:DUF2165 family protein [Chromobacterium amazonense]|uniref:DUF2165 family protein n=1 Tax=Chromobacterium amazonense TaxID=1382803 RepID=UPI00068DA4E4|nr:DUF2165 domain-containing protein [Chromobacterium amazonense]MBM2885016.1 DUF2165 domain-containing protein [Chromobacterium amazonense]MDE1714623.1 DUF2165 domain-containing protein [Chromobacterium amazonense]OHX17154.1 hypothetical protein BI343_13010 [Chromobacterium amazonense]
MKTTPHLFAQRLSKALLALSIGLFGLMVASGNLLDYDSNWQFVRHVLSMDTMQPWFHGDALRGRAIHSEAIQRLAYAAIIAGELAVGLLCAAGGAMLLLALRPTAGIWLPRGKACFTLGATLAILVWHTGFAVIGGEYFAMWANQFNGQFSAYAFTGIALLALIYVNQPESSAD